MALSFTSLDAASGFHQIGGPPQNCIQNATRSFTIYQLRVLPFGLSNAPEHSSQSCITFFKPPQHNAAGPNNPGHALTEFGLVFLDNILIFSQPANENRRYLDTVLILLHEKRILLKACKCARVQSELLILLAGTVSNPTLQNPNL